MQSRTRAARVLLAASLSIGSSAAIAGPYADDMAKCLVRSSSAGDRVALIKWMFAAMAQSPDVASLANVSQAQRDDITKTAGGLFQRLLLDSCRTETQQAIRYEGPQTVQYAFQMLGQIAARELFANPKVADGMAALTKYVDEGKLKALVAAEPPK